MMIVMIMMMRGIFIVVVMIASMAVVHLGMKTVLAGAILDRSDVTIWLLHCILAVHSCACKTPADIEVICLAQLHTRAELAHSGRVLSSSFMEMNRDLYGM